MTGLNEKDITAVEYELTSSARWTEDQIAAVQAFHKRLSAALAAKNAAEAAR